MHEQEREYHIHRITAGYVLVRVNKKWVKIGKPDINLRLKSQIIYQDILEKAKQHDIFTEEEILDLLKENGLWNKDNEKRLARIPIQLSKRKKELYQAFTSHNLILQKRIRKEIADLKQTLRDLIYIRHRYDYITCKGFASYCRMVYLIAQTVNTKKISFQKLLNLYHSEILDESQIRELARTEPWQTYWSTHKGNNGYLFCPNSAELTDEQRNLIVWSTIYDNIRQSPDCPKDSVINDDDLLDGWMACQRDDKKDKSDDKFGNADEVFIPVHNKEEARKVANMNSPKNRTIKKQRLKQAKANQGISYHQFSDRKQQLSMLRNQLVTQKRRK